MKRLLASKGLPVTIDGSVSHDSIPWMVRIAREIRRDLRLASGEGSPYSSGRRSWLVPATSGRSHSSLSIIEQPWWRDEQWGVGRTRRWRAPCRVVVIERETPGETTTRIVEHVRTDGSNSPDATDPSDLLDMALGVASTMHATTLRAAAHLASCHPEAGYLPPPECGMDSAGKALAALISDQHPGFRGMRIDMRSCRPYSEQPITRVGGNPNVTVPPTHGATRLLAPQASLELWDDRKSDRPAFSLALMRRRMGEIHVPRQPVGAMETMRSIAACAA